MQEYKVDTVSRVQAILRSKEPHRQIISIREAMNDYDYPREFETLPEFPDEPVSDGTKVFQKFKDGRIFRISVLRG
ncbi:hypothetical protein [Methanobacterium ferruginis]|uniref:hypothetical protein n=1 Tax=Methanobacterium ferruginis TaxID=710191 RepID=UPI0025727B45|nr:hypothetical protein [Methanobacterium ferruginis]BDZ68564.1 hypothetical protein GCM10025860_20120 [Methanobacterium ferruginis]